jgi:ribose transport system ATP-binding protein
VVPVLELKNLSKTFVGRQVLKSVDLTVEPGEIVGLVGQNGCGKSTLIKIVSGVYTPDTGAKMRVLGRDIPLPVTGDTAALGLAFVHQDLGLFRDGSILENMRVGRYRTGAFWRIDWARERAATAAALERIGLQLDPDEKVSALSQVDRALVAIARAVDQAERAQGSGVIVLDEPTSYLPRDGVEKLFAAVRELRSRGLGVIFVSHRLEEVLDLCDRIAVLRDGALVARLEAKSSSESDVVEAMLGRRLDAYYPSAATPSAGEARFSVRNVSGDGIAGVSLDAGRGEVYGVTGLLGMGQERLLYLFTGASAAQGAVTCDGNAAQLRTMTPGRARRMGVVLLPADRVRLSGVQEATVLENVTLPTLARYTQLGRILHRRERSAAETLIARFAVRPAEPDRQMRTLSGGNQQKALLAKWMNAEPKVILLHEATQGVDVGAKQQIFAHLRAAADAGLTVVIATTEYEDLAALCDRVMVMRDGRAAVVLEGDALTHERLVEECYKRSAA